MTGNNHQLDENLRRLLDTASHRPNPAFQERLVNDVLAEVARQRQLETPGKARKQEKEYSQSFWLRRFRRNRPAWLGKPWVWAGATAVVAVAGGLWITLRPPDRTIGQVRCLYGLVAVQNGGTSQTVSGAIDLKSGQRVKTQAGSQASIRLSDQSRLLPDPRTILKVMGTRQGPRISLEAGKFSLEAVKQPPGQAITIEAGHARVKVLGTRLDVRLVERPSGARQTRVRVLSGQVELESSGQTVMLLPGTEGVAEAGQPPVRSSIVFEVNELIRLLQLSRSLEAKSGHAYGLPAILDFTTSTVWLLVPVGALSETEPGTLSLRLRYPAFRAKAFTLDGAEIAARGIGEVLTFERSTVAGGRMLDYIILKVPGVGGLLRTTSEGHFECTLSGEDNDRPRLAQLHLPEPAQIVALAPPSFETTRERNRLIATVECRIRLPQVHD